MIGSVIGSFDGTRVNDETNDCTRARCACFTIIFVARLAEDVVVLEGTVLIDANYFLVAFGQTSEKMLISVDQGILSPNYLSCCLALGRKLAVSPTCRVASPNFRQESPIRHSCRSGGSCRSLFSSS